MSLRRAHPWVRRFQAALQVEHPKTVLPPAFLGTVFRAACGLVRESAPTKPMQSIQRSGSVLIGHPSRIVEDRSKRQRSSLCAIRLSACSVGLAMRHLPHGLPRLQGPMHVTAQISKQLKAQRQTLMNKRHAGVWPRSLRLQRPQAPTSLQSALAAARPVQEPDHLHPTVRDRALVIAGRYR